MSNSRNPSDNARWYKDMRISLQAGNVGILVLTSFAQVDETALREGLNLKLPRKDVVEFSMRLKPDSTTAYAANKELMPVIDSPSTWAGGMFQSKFLGTNNVTLHNSLVDRAKQGGIDTLFLGDSITQGMNPQLIKQNFGDGAVNFGIGGDCTSHLLWRMQNGELSFPPGKQPKVAVLMIGTNNLRSYFFVPPPSNQEIVEGVKADVNEIRKQLPGTKVLVVGILPRGETKGDELRQRISDVNSRLAAIADNQSIFFADVGSNLLQPNGNIARDVMDDFLHPTRDKGNSILLGSIKPYVDKIKSNDMTVFDSEQLDRLRSLSEQNVRSRMCEPWWQQKHDNLVRKAKSTDAQMQFYGDSITENIGKGNLDSFEKNFGELKPQNFGIGGDISSELLWRVNHGELSGHPKLRVLMIGSNDLTADPPRDAQEIAQAIGNVVKTMRAQNPDGKILLMGILPRETDEPLRDSRRAKVKEVNHIIAGLDNGDTLRYLDIGSNFITADDDARQDLLPDRLHPSHKGYEVWSDAIKPLVDKML